MNKLRIFIFLLAVTVCSCRKESGSEAYDVVPVHTDPEALLQQFTAALGSGQSVWKATLNPKTGKTYALFVVLDGHGGVSMLADLDAQSGTQLKRGSYQVKSTSTNAVLSFSAGTYLDDIRAGSGRNSIPADTSYAFRYAKEDTIALLGNRYGDELKLVYASAEERNAYNAGALGVSVAAVSQYFSARPFYSVVTPDQEAVQFTINQVNRSVIMAYASQGKVISSSADFSYGINRIYFKTPLSMGHRLVRELDLDVSTGEFFVADGAEKLAFLGSSMPVLPLHLLLGKDFPSIISLPSPVFLEELPGWSPTAIDAWFMSTLNLLNSAYQSTLLVNAFNLDTRAETMNLDIYFQIGESIYVGTFPFSYTKTTDGVYTFAALPFDPASAAHQNAGLILPYLGPWLNMVLANKFRIDYYDTGNGLLAQFISAGNPDIYFTGYFGSLFN